MNTSISDKIALFVECFGDSIEVAGEFFSCSDVMTVTKYENDRLAAMASLVPILADVNVSGYYIYGVCVGKDFRGRGLFRAIMVHAESEARTRGADFVCLVPANERLSDTYMRMGYNTKVLPSYCEGKKAIVLKSEDFRAFAACEMEAEHRCGLLKSFCNNTFCPSDEEFCFVDEMGDV